MQCPKCQATVVAGTRLCGHCGQMIDAGGSSQTPATAQPAFAGAGASASAATAGIETGATNRAPTAGLIARVKNIVLQPKLEWPVIAPEPTTIAQLYTGYVMPLAAFAAVLSFLHISVLGVSVPFAGVMRSPMAVGLESAVLYFGSSLLGLFLVGLIINVLAPRFAGTANQRQALKVAAYAFTPAWLSSVLALSPILATLLQLVALCYGIYVLYLGLPVLMRSPRERALGYTAAVVACTVLLGIILGGISVLVSGSWGPGRFGSTAAQQQAAQDQGATAVGNIVGNALGTDAKGKAGLSAALSNLVKAGQPDAAQPAAAATANNGATGNGDPTAGAPAAQSPASAVGGLVTALGGALGGDHPVAVVDFKALTAMLPASLPDMKRTNVQGANQGAVGVKTASAEGDYQGDGGARVHIGISDISGVSGLIGLAGSLVQNTTSESADGFERDQTIAGRSVHEKYDAKAHKGDLSVILAKRFEVDVSGEGVDMGTLERSLGQVDLAGLETMKAQGAHAQ
jgi:Yip1 domain